ncbi:MAG: hypothetical protein SOZ00_05930 [Tidjanibacter sp.]|nr:hypothetical protein [Tidjanibacter sp.]
MTDTFSGSAIRTQLSGAYSGTVATEPKGRAFWYTAVSEFMEVQEF